jgi:Flp pilus assembly protein TadB
MTAQPGSAPPDIGSHYLLPHERRYADRMRRLQDSRPDTAPYLRMLQNYGPEGLRLLSATIADLYLFWFILLAGLIARFVQLHGVPFVAIGVFAVAAIIGSVGMVRAAQCAREGKRFRAGRPRVRLRRFR